MLVGSDTRSRGEAQLDDLELGELAEDPMVAFRTLDPFAAVRAEGDDAVHAPSMPGPQPKAR